MSNCSNEGKENTQKKSIRNHYNQFGELPSVRMVLQLQAGLCEISAAGYSSQESYDLFCLAIERLPDVIEQLERDRSRKHDP